jgi:hypothetical protein
MDPPTDLIRMVELFRENLQAYQSDEFNEAALRLQFIDPLFELLGWDVYNRQGYAEAYKDVVHEDSLKIGAPTKAPDYSFRIRGTRRFFVEAKRPAVKIKQAGAPAFQLRRYAWSAKLPLSILTNFEELAVYDCRVRPEKNDSPATARTMYVTFDQYAERWAEIAAVFSREAVLKGSFDKYAESAKRKRGTAEVDAAFLEEIESWRSELARNMAIRNPDLPQRELNVAVQKTIDRIIFLRMCEDRGIEPYGRLQPLLNGPNVYARLGQLFREADDRYNSGLFHFLPEKGRHESPDEWTLDLAIDDGVLKEIVRKLYYPESPYEFSVLPADILGQVYEQFLGKVIRLTPGHRAVVEDKPEVKKAGGVYYTPTYIVDYIVRNTVGQRLEGKTAFEAAARTSTWKPAKGRRPLSVLDPACGSGSFLIGAYQFLLDWYRDWFIADGPARHKHRVYQTRQGQWRLTTAERKRILLDHIYGVDIDPQAVEVTKLSLLLKVLEAENKESLELQRRMFHERALPDLAANIKCGNSLIGPDFYRGQQMDLFDDDARLRINVFDWDAEFAQIMPSGGFDAVIGNPPYGFHQIHQEHAKSYFRTHYVASHGSFEHYFLFYERALTLLRKNGLHGFIVPVTWLTIPSAKSLRRFILDSYRVCRIAWLPKLVFPNAQVNTLITVIEADTPSQTRVEIHTAPGFQEKPAEQRTYNQRTFSKNDYYISIFERPEETRLIKKLESCGKPLSDFARPCSGYNPYEVGKGTRPGGGPQTEETVLTKPYHADRRHDDSWKPEIVGRDLDRYHVRVSGKRWIQYGPWLAAARDPENFLGERILVQEIVGGRERRIVGAYMDGELYHSRDVIPIRVATGRDVAYYLLAVINSRLISWYHHKRNPKAKKGLFPKVLVSDLGKLPIPPCDSKQLQTEPARRIITAVGRMLSLKSRESVVKTAHERTALQRQIEATDREIDRLVYELYGLTGNEIRIVEEATAVKAPAPS